MKISHLITGPLSVNTWCIPLDDRRLVVVDPGGDPDSIIAHVRGRGLDPALIVLTHGHFDHLIALPALVRAWSGIPVAIHPDDARFLGPGALERHYEFFVRLGAGELVREYPEELPPATVFLADGLPLSLGTADGPTKLTESDDSAGLAAALARWSVIHTPGHSPGSVCLYNETEGVLISGDTLFRSGFGRTDGIGGSAMDLERSVERLFNLPRETVVLPGHGGETTIGREWF